MSQAAGTLLDRARAAARGAGRAFTALVLFNVGAAGVAAWRSLQAYVTLPEAFILELELEQQTLVERASASLRDVLAGGGLRQLELSALLQALHAAKDDGRVRGVLAVLGGRENISGGFAQLQELRNALLEFRFTARSRAPIYAYSNAFGEGGSNGTGLYYLASACDRVFMPPTGTLSLLGFSSEQVFLRGLLDRLRVQPEVFRREQFKSALAPLTNTGFDAPHRENMTSLLQSLYGQVVEGVASARRLAPSAVGDAVDASPLLPQAALSRGLLDGLLYRDQVEQLLERRLPDALRQRHAAAMAKAADAGPLAVRSAKLATGPRVPLARYSASVAWHTGEW